MRCFSVLFIIMLVSLVGCKTEKLKTPDASTSNPQKPQPAGLLLEGSVGIGSIAGAEVTVHAFVDGAVDWQRDIGRGRTDDTGRYSIVIDDQFLTSPAVLKVVGTTNSSMHCGLSVGCGSGISFGDRHHPDQTLEVFIAVPSLQKQSFVNPSILSHLAFRHFERHAGAQKNAAAIAYQIERSNSAVASRFGVASSLVTAFLPDLAVLAPDLELDEVRASALNLGVLQATQKQQNTSGVADALARFTDQYLATGLPDVDSAENPVSLSEVYQEAVAIVRLAQQRSGLNLNSVITQLDSMMSMLSFVGDDEHSFGHASVTAGLTGVEKGKSLAEDARTFASSVDLRKLAGLSNLSQLLNDGSSTILNLFAVESAGDDVLADDDLDVALSALGFVGEAALMALAEYYADATVLTMYKNVNFTHLVVPNNHVFNFKTTYDACAQQAEPCPAHLDISLILRVTRFTGNAGTRTFAPDALDVSVSGGIEVGDIRLGLPPNEFQLRSIKPSISLSDHLEDIWVGEEYRVSADAVRIRLPFQVSHTGASDSDAYKGFFSLDTGRFNIQYTSRSISAADSAGGTSKVVSEGILRLNHVEGLKMGFVGQPEQELATAINVNQSGALTSENLVIRSSSVHCSQGQSDCQEKSDLFIEGETDDSFLSLNASVTYKTKLKSVSAPAIAQLTLSRNSLSNNSIDNIAVSYPGHNIRLTGTFNSNGGMSALSATNIDGTQLYFNTVGGKRTGMLQSVDGDKIGDVIDMGQWVKIVYVNGDFESL